MAAPVYLVGEEIVHHAYQRHQRHQHHLEQALTAAIILALAAGVIAFLACMAGIGWAVNGLINQ